MVVLIASIAYPAGADTRLVCAPDPASCGLSLLVALGAAYEHVDLLTLWLRPYSRSPICRKILRTGDVIAYALEYPL